MNLNLVAPVDGSGYGVVGLNVLKALVTGGHDVAFFPRNVRGPDPDMDLADVSLVLRTARRQRAYDVDAPCLRIAGEDDMTLFAGRGVRAGLPFFDSTRFSEVELHHLRSLDRLFVASEWGRGVAADNGLDPSTVSVAPLGVDRSVFTESPLRDDGPTVFLNVGAWQRRKGQTLLLAAFERAFRPSDDVELRFLSHNPWSGLDEDRWVAACRGSAMAEKIRVLPRVVGHRAVAETMRDADCGVFPSRAEAWNLEALEMLSCGRHVIATNFSGHTEFLDGENARLIEVDELEAIGDPEWMTVFTSRKVGQWARLGDRQLDQLVEHLRAVHDQKQRGELSLNGAGIATAEQFSWARTVERIVAGF